MWFLSLSLYYNSFIVINQLSIHMWVWLWMLFSVLMVYLSCFTAIPHSSFLDSNLQHLEYSPNILFFFLKVSWLLLAPCISTYILEWVRQFPHIKKCNRDSKRDTDIKNRLLDSVGEGEGGMIWENSIETCLLPYVKQMTSPSSMHQTGHSKPGHWDSSEGRDGEGVLDRGTHVHPWLIHVSVRPEPPQYGKVISLQL